MKIKTHYAEHCDGPWLAVDMDAAVALLGGYPLTDQEKTDLPDLMAGYCRLIDEAGLSHFGQTEDEAIASCRSHQ